MKKIKIFLGGFVNYANAQNLNCLALAKHLNKDQFDVYTLQYYAGTLENQAGKMKGVHVFNCFRPAKLSLYLGFLWGIWKCDVAYLPKEQLRSWNKFLLRFLSKKSFSTIEIIMSGTPVIEPNENSSACTTTSFEFTKMFDRLYSITNFMSTYNAEKFSLYTESKILYLGVDFEHFKGSKTNNKLENILIIGNDLIRKGIYDYLEVAKHFPQLNFYVVGSGLGKIDVNEEASKLNLKNIIYKGSQTPAQITALLAHIDLHILPSRLEGFPKVTLETAAAGVPSILYDDYGANEWITNDKDSWTVKTVTDIINIIDKLQHQPEKLKAVSNEAIQLAAKFDWKIKVKDWEEEILTLNKNF